MVAEGAGELGDTRGVSAIREARTKAIVVRREKRDWVRVKVECILTVERLA